MTGDSALIRASGSVREREGDGSGHVAVVNWVWPVSRPGIHRRVAKYIGCRRPQTSKIPGICTICSRKPMDVRARICHKCVTNGRSGNHFGTPFVFGLITESDLHPRGMHCRKGYPIHRQGSSTGVDGMTPSSTIIGSDRSLNEHSVPTCHQVFLPVTMYSFLP